MTAEICEALRHLYESLQRVEDKQDKLAEAINGNGQSGFKGRLVRLETIVTVLAAVVCILMPTLTAVGCFVAPKLLPVLTEKK